MKAKRERVSTHRERSKHELRRNGVESVCGVVVSRSSRIGSTQSQRTDTHTHTPHTHIHTHPNKRRVRCTAGLDVCCAAAVSFALQSLQVPRAEDSAKHLLSLASFSLVHVPTSHLSLDNMLTISLSTSCAHRFPPLSSILNQSRKDFSTCCCCCVS